MSQNRTRHIHYTGLLIVVTLVLFIIVNCQFTAPHAVWPHCTFRLSVNTHGSSRLTEAGPTRTLCCCRLYNEAVKLTFSSPASPWRSPSPSAASVWGPRSRIAIRSQRSSSPAPTVATVVSGYLRVVTIKCKCDWLNVTSSLLNTTSTVLEGRPEAAKSHMCGKFRKFHSRFHWLLSFTFQLTLQLFNWQFSLFELIWFQWLHLQVDLSHSEHFQLLSAPQHQQIH